MPGPAEIRQYMKGDERLFWKSVNLILKDGNR